MRPPTSAPGPVRKFSTPSGRPLPSGKVLSQKSSASFQAISMLCSAGLRTTVFPATMLALVMPQVIAFGKFQGGITAPTPSGI